ncbi:hypothetical protein QR685DRAFT_86660 [Neurospora intermedia]|uniref:Uncharacterized protein n=1 Tax=Neurospora intermedia TaxID=5142 RepID=A0ABR3D3W9_NEUIN
MGNENKTSNFCGLSRTLPSGQGTRSDDFVCESEGPCHSGAVHLFATTAVMRLSPDREVLPVLLSVSSSAVYPLSYRRKPKKIKTNSVVSVVHPNITLWHHFRVLRLAHRGYFDGEKFFGRAQRCGRICLSEMMMCCLLARRVGEGAGRGGVGGPKRRRGDRDTGERLLFTRIKCPVTIRGPIGAPSAKSRLRSLRIHGSLPDPLLRREPFVLLVHYIYTPTA